MVTPVRLRVVSTHRFVENPTRPVECKWCGRVERVHVEGVTITTYVCEVCGCAMPNAKVYKDFHLEHCPNVGTQR